MWNNVLLVVLSTIICIQTKKVEKDISVEFAQDINVGLNDLGVNSINFGEPLGTGELEDTRRRGRHRKKDALRVRNVDQVFFNPKGNLRIRGGNASDTRNFPYIAGIIINGRMWCVGTIIDVNWIITAAHCLNYVLLVSPLKKLSQHVKVRVGSAKPHEGGMVVDVAGAVRHPKYEEEPVPHADIALLKLTNNLEFNRHINLLKIYQGLKEPFAQSFIVVTGWGANRGALTAFREHTIGMMPARLKVRTQNFCIDSYQDLNGFLFSDDLFCASLRNGSRDACLFDAGAPAVQQNKLMGVMSFGPEVCGHPDGHPEPQPAVFVKAFYFRDFVRTTIAAYKTNAELIEAMQDIDPEGPLIPLHGAVTKPKEVDDHEELQNIDILDPHFKPS